MSTSPHDAADAYSRYLDSLIPDGYEEREGYRYCPITKMIAATVRPPTGVAILDTPGPGRTADIMARLTQSELMAMAEHEAMVGIRHDTPVTKFAKNISTPCGA